MKEWKYFLIVRFYFHLYFIPLMDEVWEIRIMEANNFSPFRKMVINSIWLIFYKVNKNTWTPSIRFVYLAGKGFCFYDLSELFQMRGCGSYQNRKGVTVHNTYADKLQNLYLFVGFFFFFQLFFCLCQMNLTRNQRKQKKNTQKIVETEKI